MQGVTGREKLIMRLNRLAKHRQRVTRTKIDKLDIMSQPRGFPHVMRRHDFPVLQRFTPKTTRFEVSEAIAICE